MKITSVDHYSLQQVDVYEGDILPALVLIFIRQKLSGLTNQMYVQSHWTFGTHTKIVKDGAG